MKRRCTTVRMCHQPQLPMIHARDIEPPLSNADALAKLIGTPDLCSRRWVWEQYDHVIGGNTVQRPGGDAAVVRVQDGPKGLALTADVTPRYCEADPFEGGKQAVAEAWRNITAVGGRPLALTDNLNFGNPERPEIMGQFVGCLKGIADACRALDFPVVSGNVSLYNETNGRGILPTPTIGGVGLLDDFTKSATLAFKREGEAILLIGETHGWLGQSLYLRDICGREEGAPPPVDLEAEKRNGDVVRGLIIGGTASAVHDRVRRRPVGRNRRNGDGRRDRCAARRRAVDAGASCVVVRRGSGALCRDRAGRQGA
jgi:phosphoribosylformylglycinamidine (FGAM) synthase-like enzyme